MSHVGDRALEFVLELLPEAENAALLEHVRGCTDCASEVARAADEAAMLASANVEELAPAAAVKERLDLSLASFSDRIAHYLEPLARMADIANEVMAGVISGLDDLANWLPGPGDGLRVGHVPSGPLTANAVVGFVRIAPGDSFPTHRHEGKEVVLVVQGSYRDSDGTIVRAGDVAEQDVGTTHSLVALDGPDLIYLAVVEEGIDISGDLIDAEDERF